MFINYETKKINKTLYDFYNSTGITINLLDADFNLVSHTPHEFSNYCKCIQKSESGKKACRHSDIELLKKCKESKKTQIHVCHAGLVDVAVPVNYDGEIIGYMILGQMKTNSDFSQIKARLKIHELDINKMNKLYDSIELYDSEKIESVSNIAAMLIKYILLENMLKPDVNPSIQKAVNYINGNLSDNLTIKSITKNANVSKSVLYKNFHEEFGCSVSEFINRKRIENAKLLLKKSELSVEDISQRLGYSNASYFSKMFKKCEGISPLKYRKLNN